MHDQEFRYEAIHDGEGIVRCLRTLADGFEKRELLFRSGEDEIILRPGGLIDVEIKAKNKSRKSKISIKFVWKETPTPKTVQAFPADGLQA